MPNSEEKDPSGPEGSWGLKKLTAQQVRQIDEELVSVSEYGEIHLIVQHGRIRYVNRIQSYRAWDNYYEKTSET